MERLQQLRLRTVEGFRVRFKPGETDLTKAKEFGYLPFTLKVFHIHSTGTLLYWDASVGTKIQIYPPKGIK